MMDLEKLHDLYNLTSTIDLGIKKALENDQSLSSLLRTSPLPPHELQSISVYLQNTSISHAIASSVQMLFNRQRCISILDSEDLSSESIKVFIDSFKRIKRVDRDFDGRDGISLFVGKCCELVLSCESVQEIASVLAGLRYVQANKLYEGIDALLEDVLQEFDLALNAHLIFGTIEELDGYLWSILLVKKMNFHIDPDTFEVACYSMIMCLGIGKWDLEVEKRIIMKLPELEAEDQEISTLIQDLEVQAGLRQPNILIFNEHSVPRLDQPGLITRKAQLEIEPYPLNQNNCNANPRIFVFKAKLPNGGAAVVKEYVSADRDKVIEEGGKEARIMEAMSGSPSFIEYLGHYEEHQEGKFCFGVVMEYCPSDLMQHIMQALPSPAFTQSQLQTMTRELVSAFADMHSKGFFHLDIKPHNICIKSGLLKITDFNVSGICELAQVATTTHAQNHPAQGTEGYMAPELQVHFDRRRVDSTYSMKDIGYIRDRADVYSLGVTFLKMYTCGDIAGLNTEGGQERLQELLAQVQYQWLQKLLRSMLVFDFNARPKMRDLIELLPLADATERPTTSFLRD